MARRKRWPPEIAVSIGDLDVEGLGTARFGERPVGVKNALPGESVTARVVTKRAGRLLAVAETIDDPATYRVEPFCGHFPRCGGCSFQHWHYERQLAFKHELLVEALREHGVIPDALDAPRHTISRGYRRRARLGVRWLEKAGRVYVGFRESFGSYVADMESCPALAPPLADLIEPLRSLVTALSHPHRIPQIELAAGDAHAAIVIRHLEPFSNADLDRLRSFADTWNVWVYGQAAGYDSVVRLFPAGTPDALLSYRNDEYDLDFSFSPTDFVQVNAATNLALTRGVVDSLELGDGDRVLDLFCGLGNFTLPIARAGVSVHGLELSASAVDMARHNARGNDLARLATFAVANLHERHPEDLAAYDKVVLDPPRSGAGPCLAELAQPARRIVYVSCNPTTFASDASVLESVGFGLARAGVYDMFPHTGHVEVLGVFERRRW